MEIRRHSWLLLVALELLMPSHGRSPITPEISSALYAHNIVGRTFDFSHLTNNTKGVQLTFNGKPISLDKFRIPEADTEKLETFLVGEKLEDRLNVLTRLVGINKMIADKYGIESNTFALEDMDDIEDDVILDREDIDEMELRIQQEPATLDLNSPPSILDENSVHAKTLTSGRRLKRHVLEVPSRKWSGEIPYIITSDFEKYPTLRRNILGGIENWEEETCLKFKSVESFSGPHLIFKRLKRCHSKRGRRPQGQIISIGTGCGTRGHVVHEIAHSIGLSHEQSRPDRSKYVDIIQDNIKFPRLRDFMQESWKNAITLGVPYNYASVMHNDAYRFTKNKNKTMTAKEEDMDSTLGSRFGLSFFDAANANYFYCQGKCKGGLTWSKCKHDGYRDPKNCTICKCPDGWTGRYCTEVANAVNETCGRKELTARSKWKLLTSPHYEGCGTFSESHCTWRIRAPGRYKRVVMKFIRSFSLQKNCVRETCTHNYVEVRHKDAAKAGPRYCCKKPSMEFKSHGNSMLLLMRITKEGKQKGFKLGYKYESCGGCSSNTSISGPPCLATSKYRCDGFYTERCGFLWSQNCTRYRVNTCYKEVKYCCPGFKLSKDGVCYRYLTNGTAPCERGRVCNLKETDETTDEHRKLSTIQTVGTGGKVQKSAAREIIESTAHRIPEMDDENESSREDMPVVRMGQRRIIIGDDSENEREDGHVVRMGQRRRKVGDNNESVNEDRRIVKMDRRRKQKSDSSDSERDERRVVKTGQRRKKKGRGDRRVPRTDQRRKKKGKTADSERNDGRVVKTGERRPKFGGDNENEREDGHAVRTGRSKKKMGEDRETERQDGRVVKTGQRRKTIGKDSDREDGRVRTGQRKGKMGSENERVDRRGGERRKENGDEGVYDNGDESEENNGDKSINNSREEDDRGDDNRDERVDDNRKAQGHNGGDERRDKSKDERGDRNGDERGEEREDERKDENQREERKDEREEENDDERGNESDEERGDENEREDESKEQGEKEGETGESKRLGEHKPRTWQNERDESDENEKEYKVRNDESKREREGESDESEEEYKVSSDEREREHDESEREWKSDESEEEYKVGNDERGDESDESEREGESDESEREGESDESEEEYKVGTDEREREHDESDREGESHESEEEYKLGNDEREDESDESEHKGESDESEREGESDESEEGYKGGTDEREGEDDYYEGRNDFESEERDEFESAEDNYEDDWEEESYENDGEREYEYDGEDYEEYEGEIDDFDNEDEFEGESYENEGVFESDEYSDETEGEYGDVRGYGDEGEEWEYGSEENEASESEEGSYENEGENDRDGEIGSDGDEEWEPEGDGEGENRGSEGRGDESKDREDDDEGDIEDETEAGNGSSDAIDYDNSYDY